MFHFQWTSPDSLEDKWLRWQRLERQVNRTSLGDDACETLTIAGLEKATERALEQHLRLRAPQTWTVLLCASVDQYLRTAVDSGSQPTPVEIGAVMSTCACCGKAGHEVARCRFRNALDTSERCADNVKSLLASQVPRTAVARVLAKAVRAVEAQTSAIVVNRLVIDDMIALVETRVVAFVASVVI